MSADTATPATAAVLWAAVLLPAVVGAVLLVARRPGRAAPALSIGTAAATAVLAAAAALTRPASRVAFLPGLDFALGVDALSALLLPTVAIVTLLVLVFAAGDGIRPPARFHGLMLLFASAALVTACATTLPTLLFAWEVMGAASYALIGFQWRADRKVSSGATAFLTTRASDLGLYLAAAAAVAGGAGLAFADLPSAPGGWRDAIAAGIVLAALGKAAQLPFSFWLSRAMDGPSPVSALLHSAAMVALGGYLLLRVSPLLQVTPWAATTVAWIGVGTSVVLGVVALAQHDLKQRLAASTAAQLGFVVLAAGVGAVSGGAAHLIGHASAKAALFLGAGAWLTALGTKHLSALAGVARRWKIVGVAFTVATLALAGVPPLSLWATKDAALAPAREASGWLYAAGLLASALSAAYAGATLRAVWPSLAAAQTEHYDEEEKGTRRIGALQSGPLVVLAAGSAVLGVLALPPLAGALASALGSPLVARPGLTEWLVSGAIALVVTALAMRVRIPTPSAAHGWFGLEAATQAGIVRPTLALARALARFDDHALDRGVLAAGRAAMRVADSLARVDDAGLDSAVSATTRGGLRTASAAGRLDVRVDDAVERVASGVRAAGRAARRPQSGQLHRYLTVAVASLAAVSALALVLVLIT